MSITHPNSIQVFEHLKPSLKAQASTPDWGDDAFQNVRIQDAGGSVVIPRTRSARPHHKIPLDDLSEMVAAMPSALPDALHPLLRKAVTCIDQECRNSPDYSPLNSQQLNIVCNNVSGQTDGTQSNILVAHFIRAFTDCVALLPANENLHWAIAIFNACMDHRKTRK